MTTAIVKFNKQGLWEMGQSELFLENSFDLTILQYADNVKSTTYTIPFEISVAEEHAPQIDTDIVVVIREKVDLTARGPNDVTIKNIGKDVGGENYIDKMPYRPKELPPGFEEVLKL
jgi:hypothetical protein